MLEKSQVTDTHHQNSACLQVVDYLVRQGFYVNVDFHSIGFHKTLVTGETPFSGADDYSLYDIPGWTQLW